MYSRSWTGSTVAAGLNMSSTIWFCRGACAFLINGRHKSLDLGLRVSNADGKARDDIPSITSLTNTCLTICNTHVETRFNVLMWQGNKDQQSQRGMGEGNTLEQMQTNKQHTGTPTPTRKHQGRQNSVFEPTSLDFRNVWVWLQVCKCAGACLHLPSQSAASFCLAVMSTKIACPTAEGCLLQSFAEAAAGPAMTPQKVQNLAKSCREL